MTTLILDDGRVLVRDEATGLTEELRLDADTAHEQLELVVETDDDLSSRHYYCP